jgi:response regulator RpfG family c-di-GMP phosphodiesterase
MVPDETTTSRILVVENDDRLREFYIYVLTAQGHLVVGAESVTKTGEVLRTEDEGFGLMVIDVPSIRNDIEFLKSIRKEQTGTRVLCIASGTMDRESLKEVRRHCHDLIVRTNFGIATFCDKANYLAGPAIDSHTQLRLPPDMDLSQVLDQDDLK